MHRIQVAFALLFLTLAPALIAHTADSVPETWRAVSEHGPWVVQIDFDSREEATSLDRRFDVWRVDPIESLLELQITLSEYHALVAEGYAPILDLEKTLTLSRLHVPLQNQGSGIPGFPCYRTVEETYATAQSIVQEHPDLASWIDIGDSWQKTQDPESGWDLFVLKLTRSSVPGPKPVFFSSFAIHAREYTTAELGTRFAEYLVDGYGDDPDITWLLDEHEVHLLLQANPDGRKMAETGLSWRKNTNNEYCSNTNNRGADLNRNFEFEWGCCGGSSGNQCTSSYRGPAAASEPEIQALQDYVRSIFPDQRGPDLSEPAPDDATGVAMDVHSAGELILWPWGFTTAAPGNGTALATLGRKIAFFNDHLPLPIWQLTNADGSSVDFYYGELGVAGIAFELGTQFFENCSFFENNVVPGNIDALFYGAQVARTPYLTPAGPETVEATAPTDPVMQGDLAVITAVLDDARFNQSNGTEPTQTIASAQAFVDVPPWRDGATPLSMAAADGTFDEANETVEITIDTSGLSHGRHLIYVRGIDSAGNEGLVGAAFLDVDATIFADGFESGDLSAWSK